MGGGALGNAAKAQSILYQIGDASPVSITSGAEFEIDVGTVTGVLLVRVWDPQFVNGLPNDDAGKITITGTAGSSAELQVLVAGPDESWDENPQHNYLETGVRHLGLNANDGIVVTDAGLRARTRLAAFTSGDIRGTISVGQVQRLQLGNLNPSEPTGTLAAHVTATGHRNAFGHGEEVIAEVVAGNVISGSLTAAGDASFSVFQPGTYANIGRIIVGPSVNAAGISGDIAAEQGRIAEVWTAGPIAREGSVLPTIRAGNGIKWLRTAVLSTGSYSLVARDVIADINSRTLIDSDPANFDYHMPYPGGGVADGVIESLEVGGDLRGHVRAANLGCSGGLNPLVPLDCTRPGIFVQGIMYADVDVQFNVHHANIVARTMLGEIVIGRFIKGCVVATGGAQTPDPPVPGYHDGSIASLTIGRGVLPQAAEQYYGLFVPGLCGIDFEPLVPQSPDSWFSAPGLDGGAIDGLVRAQARIGTLDCRTLSLDYVNGGCKHYAPRVEAPIIGSLTIDDFVTGSVWSGTWDANDPGVGYAAVDEVNLGCMKGRASVWMKDWSQAAVRHNMFGNIFVPSVPADRSLIIGGILGDENAGVYRTNTTLLAELCRCSVIGQGVCDPCAEANVLYEDSPRDPDYPRCQAFEDGRGQVWIADAAGLHGQVIVNGAVTGLVTDPLYPTVEPLWTGAVQLGVDSSDCAEAEISPAQSQPWESPYYEQHAASLGGGAVGLVPFHLHAADCEPPADSDPQDRTFLNSAFCHVPYAGRLCDGFDPGQEYLNDSIVLWFYGPVRAESEGDRPYQIGIEINGQPDFSTPYEMWTTYTILPDYGGTMLRRIEISGGELTMLVQGHYYLRPRTTGTGRLLCAGLLPGAAATPAADFTYEFWLLKDCNTNGVPDDDEQTGFCCLNPCDPDYNRDGNADQEDVAYLVAAIASGYSPTGRNLDFNGDGNADQDDVAALVNTIGGGGCP